jgi:hypothetical protein
MVQAVGNQNHSGSSKPSNSIYDSLKTSQKKKPNTQTLILWNINHYL